MQRAWCGLSVWWRSSDVSWTIDNTDTVPCRLSHQYTVFGRRENMFVAVTQWLPNVEYLNELVVHGVEAWQHFADCILAVAWMPKTVDVRLGGVHVVQRHHDLVVTELLPLNVSCSSCRHWLRCCRCWQVQLRLPRSVAVCLCAWLSVVCGSASDLLQSWLVAASRAGRDVCMGTERMRRTYSNMRTIKSHALALWNINESELSLSRLANVWTGNGCFVW